MSLAARVEEAPPRPAIADADVPASVREFCAREEITEELQIALTLLKRHFPMVRPEMVIRRDPECGDEWVSIHIRFPGSRDDFSDRCRRYTHEWVDLTRWPGMDKFALSYGVV